MTAPSSGPLAAFRRARLGVQLGVFETVLMALVIAAAFLALSVEIRAITQRFFVRQLRGTQREVLSLQNRSLEQLVWTSSIITQSPNLRAAIETYRVESLSGHAMRAELLGTIQDEVEKIVAGLGKDLLVVTDDRGRVLAASERHGVHPRVGADVGTLPAVRRALDPSLPADASNFGVVRFGETNFQIGCVPITLQDVPIGTLILGDRLDETFLHQLREAFDGEIAVTRQGQLLSATLPVGPSDSSRDAALLEGVQRTSAGGGTVRLGGEEFVTAALPLGADPSGAAVTLHLLQPLSAALGPLDRALRVDFLLYGAVAVILAGLGAVLASRSVLTPLGKFVQFMESVAQSGEYSRRFDAAGATAEIRTLDSSYDHLIASLAQKHTELERQSAELTRANVVLTTEVEERQRAETALRSSEEQLRQSQKLEAIGTLAGGVAHDFNNLLTVIQSYTELVLVELEQGSQFYEDLQQVKQASVRASTLTKQLLAFSRKQVLQPRVLDLNDVVAGVEKMLQRVIGEDIDLRTEKATTLSRVLADPGQLEQVIMNLAVNARDAMPRGGRLTIATGNVELGDGDPRLAQPMPAGEWVMLAVSDTGTGMDEATRVRIFEPFFTTKDPGKGTGLGLSTVYGIVKQSGGFIWVDSEVGQGTTFRIYFPPVVGVRDSGGHTIAITESLGGSETILVVEDEEPVRLLACRCLEQHGYRVLVASRPVDAELLAQRHVGPIHLLLTDVVMPGESGRVLAERLMTRHTEMRVLYMSGYTNDAVVHYGVLAPGVELLEKPFDPTVLARRVREVLDRPGSVAPVFVAGS